MNKIAYICQSANKWDYMTSTAANGFKNAFIERGDTFRFFDLDKLRLIHWPSEKIKLTMYNPDIIVAAVEDVRHLPLNILKPATLVLSGPSYSSNKYDDSIQPLTEKAKKLLNKYSSRHHILISSPYNRPINEKIFSGYETELGLKTIQLLHCVDKTKFTAPMLNPEFDFLWLGNTTRRITAYKSLIVPLKKEFSNFLEYTQHNMIRPEVVESEKLYARAYILPNLHTDAQVQHNMLLNQRLFTATASGGFQICNNALARTLFKEDELLIATESNDFIEKAHHYIAHPEQRIAMIEKMQLNILKNHTYANRASEIIAALR